MYGELRFLEDEMTRAGHAGRDTREMIARLDRLEEQANRLKVPVAYASMLYMLRNHIDLVRQGLMHQGLMHQGLMHQGLMHQGLMHEGIRKPADQVVEAAVARSQ